ncbi:MAG: tRNA adenosine(34) deaminase TadA [Gammaproteobacteria bacterium]|nr:tRNA adenosine(34) deaminase TadA [Gammaproteobacteria bacterium]MDD9875048.1 tRNA adenosine(34) deaminase TadA [Gammaproteobacteria bacterium]
MSAHGRGIDIETDRVCMAAALDMARQARDANEVPVGAVVALDGEIIGRGYNRTVGLCDPGAHAEMLAIRDAARALGNHRLAGACLYVTLEPCVMCAGAIAHARIDRLVFGARDRRFGAAGGALNLLESPFLNHRCQVVAGIEAHQCGALLREFFACRRSG